MSSQRRWTLIRFWRYLKPHLPFFLGAALLGIVRFSVPLLTPWCVKLIIDDILLNPAKPESYHQLYWVLGILGLVFAFWGVLNFIRLYMNGVAGNKVIFDLRHSLFCHLQKMSPSFFEKKQIGDVVSRLTQDISKAEDLVGYLVTTTLIELSAILVIGVILFSLHPALALVSLTVVPFYAFVSYRFSRKIRSIGKSLQERTADLSSNIYEKFSAHAMVLSFVKESYEEQKFKEDALAHYGVANQNFKMQAMGISLTSWLSLMAPLLVIGYGSICVLNGSLSLGALIAFYAYVAYLFSPITRLTELSVVIAGSYAALERVFEMLDIAPEIKDSPTVISPQLCRGHIEFKNVFYDYGQNQDKKDYLVKGVNLEVFPEDYIVLKGASGAGKSTLAKLLMRFLEVDSGEILIDGLNIKDWKIETLRNNIGYVAQEPVLFHGTIEENLFYGKSDSNKEGVERYTRAACIHDFILSLPEGYQTLIGERGCNLSIGQKQRIAIARALIKEPSVLILDEPTSSLDEKTAKVVEQNIYQLRQGKVTLLITHTSSLAGKAHRVFDLSDGHIRTYHHWDAESALLKSS